MAGRPPRLKTPEDLGSGSDSSPLAAQGIRLSVDNKTLFHTPSPLAASTVAKSEKSNNRFLAEAGTRGSFLDQDDDFTPSSPLPNSLDELKIGSLSLSDLDEQLKAPVTVKKGTDETRKTGDKSQQELASSTRSSLGIMNLDQIQDLSSSMLYDPIPHKDQGMPQRRSQVPGNRPPPSRRLSQGQRSLRASGSGQQVKGIGMDVVGNMVFPGDMGEDMEASLHEIQFDDQELEQFDEEFSDFGEFDHTMHTEDFPDSLGYSLPPGAPPSNLEAVRAAHMRLPDLDEVDSGLSARPELPEKRDSIDGSINGDGPTKKQTNLLRGRAKDSRLDSLYFGTRLSNGADGEEELAARAPPSARSTSIYFEHSEAGPRSPLDTESSEEMDTEDELEQLRQEIARRLDDDDNEDDQHGQRPGLEGGSSEDNDTIDRRRVEVRQSAEGDTVPSPVPGDGGGGGDGSSGHSSDDDARPVAASDSGTRSHVGRSESPPTPGFHDPFEEDDPEAQRRIQPMGDDLLDLNPASQRQVRFLSPADFRGRTLSGASQDLSDSSRASTPQRGPSPEPPVGDSDEERGDLQASTSGGHQESHLDLQFLLPTSAGMSMSHASLGASQASMLGGGGLENSTFNLADLIASQVQLHDLDSQSARAADKREGLDGQDMTFSQRMSFGEVADFSQLAAETGSPVSERDQYHGERRGSRDSRTSAQSKDSGLGQGHAVQLLDGKIFLSENSPVYINEDGEVVTDLAYKISLGQLAVADPESQIHNPFDVSSQGNADQLGFAEAFSGTDSEFIPGDQGLTMLDQAEEQFEKENIFREDEVMDVTIAEEEAAANPQADSWSYKSALYDVRPSFLELPDEPYMRISMGTFMEGRTEALGSLDGIGHSQRPSFGSKIAIVTPPGNRQPVPLLHKGDIANQSTVEQHRGPGVGSDVDFEGEGAADRTLQAEELDRTSLQEIEGEETGKPKDSGPKKPETNNNVPTSKPTRPSQPSDQDSDDTSSDSDHPPPPAEKPLIFNVSEIARAISSASADVSPTELANLILKASHAKRAMLSQQASATMPEKLDQDSSKGGIPTIKVRSASQVSDGRQSRSSSPLIPQKERMDKSSSDISSTKGLKAADQSASRRPDGKSGPKLRQSISPSPSASRISSTGSTGGSTGSSSRSKPSLRSSQKQKSSMMPREKVEGSSGVSPVKSSGISIKKADTSRVKEASPRVQYDPSKKAPDRFGSSSTASRGSAAAKRETSKLAQSVAEKKDSKLRKSRIDTVIDQQTKIQEDDAKNTPDFRSDSRNEVEWNSPRPSSVYARSFRHGNRDGQALNGSLYQSLLESQNTAEIKKKKVPTATLR